VAGFGYAVVGIEINLLVLDRGPQPFDEDVVSPGATPVHTDLDTLLFQYFCKLHAREMRALVGVEDLGCAIAGQGFLQRLDADRKPSDPPRLAICTIASILFRNRIRLVRSRQR
jgi:hypothetical protein